MNKRVWLSLFLSVTISIAAIAQQAVQPSAERLRTHITYLASDALEGRHTGTAGAQTAAQYIAKEFARMGLKPGNAAAAKDKGVANAKYLQPFPYVAAVELGRDNVFRLTPSAAGEPTIDFRTREDWTPLGFSSNDRIADLPVAFVNHGISAPELQHYDYAGKPANGYIAIALAGTPDGDNPHGKFARYEDVRWKAIAARNAGAKALLVIARDQNFKQDSLSRLRYDNSGGDAGLPVAALSAQTGERLLQLSKLGAVKLTLQTDIVRREMPASNVVGILEGSDPTLKNEAIVIGAHYDHLGRDTRFSRARHEGGIHYGADDNASGVAGILELARVFTSQKTKPRRSIVFIAFGGEEEGLLGSNYYVNHPVVPITNTIAMINLDMVGRLKNKNLIIGGVGTAPEWKSIIETANLWQGMTVTATGSSHQNGGGGMPVVVGANGQTVVSNDPSKSFHLTLNQDGFGPSDHSSFYGKQIPVLFFWTGTHGDYHKPSDTADKINYDGEVMILGMVQKIVREIDANNKRPTYAVTRAEGAGRATGFRVYLGTVPNYSDSGNGLLLDGVREDSPAAKSGLKAGDRIVKLAGRDVRDVYDYTAALGEMKAGQEYDVEIVRGTERLKLKLTPAARR